MECCKRWRSLIKASTHCHVITDQRSVAFLFNKRQVSKIKNEKIMRWRLELIDINLDISYRPGREIFQPTHFHDAHQFKLASSMKFMIARVIRGLHDYITTAEVTT